MPFQQLISHLFILHLQARHQQKQLKARSAHPQNVHETRVLLASSSCQQQQLPHFLRYFLTLLFFPLTLRLGDRGDARETATDRREGGEQRGEPCYAQTEEPPALLPLPNQTRAGSAGTGLLPLW